jgi:hypothetical protein
MPKDKTLGTARRVRLFKTDHDLIKEIADGTMHPEIAVTRLAVNAGLTLIAKRLGIKLPEAEQSAGAKKAA